MGHTPHDMRCDTPHHMHITLPLWLYGFQCFVRLYRTSSLTVHLGQQRVREAWMTSRPDRINSYIWRLYGPPRLHSRDAPSNTAPHVICPPSLPLVAEALGHSKIARYDSVISVSVNRQSESAVTMQRFRWFSAAKEILFIDWGYWVLRRFYTYYT